MQFKSQALHISCNPVMKNTTCWNIISPTACENAKLYHRASITA